MGKVLDLRPMMNATFELILSDTDTLRLTKPTETMMTQLYGLYNRHQAGEGDVITDLELINGLLAEILSRNTEGRAISAEEAASFPLDAKMMIIMGYMEWAIGFEGPNSNAPSSPAATETAGSTP